MDEKISIREKPDWITYEDIHQLLYTAHESNREAGFNVKTALMTPSELESHIGESGKCFVALDGDKLVGTTSVRIVDRDTRYAKGRIADQILLAVLPDYSGRHISRLLHEKVVSFAGQAGVSQIEIRTAADNKKMQAVAVNWGFSKIDFLAYPGLDHYSVVLMKWLGKCPFSKGSMDLRFRVRRLLVKARYKPGKIKRLL